MRFIRIIFLSLLFLAAPLFALIPNIPSGTLTPQFEIYTRTGAVLHNAVGYAPHPVIPPYAIPSHWSGSGLVVLDVLAATGFVYDVRILQSTGLREVDHALVDTLLRWRIRPHSVYKLYVPVRVTADGKFWFGG